MPACVYYGTPWRLPSRVDLSVFLLDTSTPSFPLADDSDHLSVTPVAIQPVNKHLAADRTTSSRCTEDGDLRCVLRSEECV